MEQDVLRHSHLIDPTLGIWGWQIPIYLFLGGVSAGLMILSGALHLYASPDGRSRASRWMPLSVLVLLSLGMLALFFDLELRHHVFRFYTTFRPTSPMSWGAWILVAIYPASLAFGMAEVDAEEVNRLSTVLRLSPRMRRMLDAIRSGSKRRADLLARINIGLGLALGAYTGILLGTLGARAAYASVLLAPLFLVSGVSTGAASMMLFPLSHAEHTTLRRWDLAAIGIEALVLALWFVGFASSGATGHRALALFFGGAYTVPFWSLVAFAGLLVPAVLEIAESRSALRPTLMAPALVLFGGLALRFIIVFAGQA